MLADIQAMFGQQPLMHTLGVTLTRVADGEVELKLPFSTAWTQQTGALHAGVVTAVLDSACGFAAATRRVSGRTIVSVEFKLNLLSPAIGSELIAIGRIVRAGRTLTVCTGDAWAIDGASRTHVAIMQATMMQVAASV